MQPFIFAAVSKREIKDIILGQHLKHTINANTSKF